jgi:hypothetical protein
MKRMKRGTVLLAAALVALAVLPAIGAAKTIKVKTTIADAIAQASDGDTIVVPPGTYEEGSLLAAQDDPAETIDNLLAFLRGGLAALQERAS